MGDSKMSDINKINCDNNNMSTTTASSTFNSVNNIKQQNKCRSSSPLNKPVKNAATSKHWQQSSNSNSSNICSRDDGGNFWSRNKVSFSYFFHLFLIL